MAQSLTETLVAEVRAELARHRISATAVAQRLERSEAYVSRRLTGEIPLDVNDLSTIADMLGMPVAQLVARAELAEQGKPPTARNGRGSTSTHAPSGERNGL